MTDIVPKVSDALIEEAVGRLDMTARLEGPNRLLYLDVRLPPDAEAAGGDLLFLMRAAAELHTETQAGEEMADMEETLEDALKADDAHGIDEGCDIYRSLLASRLKEIWRGQSGPGRLEALGSAPLKTPSA